MVTDHRGEDASLERCDARRAARPRGLSSHVVEGQRHPRRCAVCGVRHCCVNQFGDARGRRYHDQRLKIAGRRLATPRRVLGQHGDDRQLFILDSAAHPLDQSCQWRRVAAGVDDHEVRSGRRAPDASGCVIRIASAGHSVSGTSQRAGQRLTPIRTLRYHERMHGASPASRRSNRMRIGGRHEGHDRYRRAAVNC
jgi:hypothetical protein